MWKVHKNAMALAVMVSWHVVTGQTLPFPFGNTTGDTFTVPADTGNSGFISLPMPMSWYGGTITEVNQNIDGYMNMRNSLSVLGQVAPYSANIDTTNGGANQDEVWVRAGTNQTDLLLAQDIIKGNGTMFTPNGVVVATWNKVVAAPGGAGSLPQNTFQVILAYSKTGATWLIFAYSQLEFYATRGYSKARVYHSDETTGELTLSFEIDSNAKMQALLSGTNCNRTGVYVYQINAARPSNAPSIAPTDAPSEAPTEAPSAAPKKTPSGAPIQITTSTKCGLLGWSLLCPFTFCGLIGRWLGLCQSNN